MNDENKTKKNEKNIEVNKSFGLMLLYSVSQGERRVQLDVIDFKPTDQKIHLQIGMNRGSFVYT